MRSKGGVGRLGAERGTEILLPPPRAWERDEGLGEGEAEGVRS